MKNILFLLFFLPLFTQAQVIVTAVGNGTSGFSGDGGLATAAELTAPYGLAVDDSGNLYISDNLRIRKVSPGYGGTITTIAGTGAPGNTGDNGLAIHAHVDGSGYISVDEHGNIYTCNQYYKKSELC